MNRYNLLKRAFIQLMCFSFIILLISCISFRKNSKREAVSNVYNSGPVLLTFPEVGEKTTKSVGEEMVSQGIGYLHETLFISTEQEVYKGFILHKGKYTWFREDANRIRFSNAKDRREEKAVFYNKNTNIIQIDHTEYPNITFELKKTFTVSNTSLQQTLLYNGRIGNVIKLSYREFLNGMARAAYSNDVEYDINQSSIISYKGASFEILNADNSEITYKVIKGFN